MTEPFLDAFGTRLDPSDLRAGLGEFGVPSVRLEVGDDELWLHVAGRAQSSDEVSRAVTWLRGQFSPLVPVHVRVDADEGAEGAEVVDVRRAVRTVIALAEAPDPEALDEAVGQVLDRLGVSRGSPSPEPPPPIPACDGEGAAVAAAWCPTA